MVQYDRTMIRNLFLEYWEQSGFKILPPCSIIPPTTWNHSLFVVSGLISYINLALNKKSFVKNLTTCQPCVKLGTTHLNLDEMLARDGYLTFFEQLSCGGGKHISVEEYIKLILTFLNQVAEIDTSSLSVGIAKEFAQYTNIFIACGLEPNNILFPDPKAFQLNIADNIKGTYIPIYVKRNWLTDTTCNQETCSINCDCGRYIEICDIGIVYVNEIRILDHGMSIERLLMIMNQTQKISDLQEFQLANSILGQIGIKDKMRQLVSDQFRTSLMLIASGIIPGNKGSSYALRSLLRRIYWLLVEKSNFQLIIDINNLTQQLWEIFELSYFFPNSDLKYIKKIIKDEIQKIQLMMSKARKEIKKILKRKKNLSSNDYKFLFNTHGIPNEFVQYLVSDLISK